MLRNCASDKGHINIPAVYRPLKYKVLEFPWKASDYDRALFYDVCINILGFMPLGLLSMHVFHLLGCTSSMKQLIVAVMIGSAFSLFIELSQVYLPARSSSLMDVLCNTLGPYGGSTFYIHLKAYIIARSLKSGRLA